MPTILRFRGFRIVIFTREHEPPHVHAIRGRDFIVFVLNCRAGPATERESKGVTRAEQRALLAFVNDNIGVLCEAWRVLRGQR
jgi:hypothetical protein